MKSFILLILLALFVSSAQGLPLVKVDQQTDLRNLSEDVELFIDKTKKLSYKQVSSCKYNGSFVRTSKEKLSLGYTDSAAWIRFEVKNNAKYSLDFSLELPIPWINHIEIYMLKGSHLEKKLLGSMSPVHDRLVPSTSFFLPFSLLSSQRVSFYIRLSGEDPLTIAPVLYSKEYAQVHNLYVMLYIGAIIGILLVMILFYFVIALSTKDMSYGYYLLYLSSLLLLFGTYYGYTYLLIWPESPLFNREIHNATLALALFSGLLFARSFLNTEKFFPRFDKFLLFFLLVLFLLFGINFVSTKHYLISMFTDSLVFVYAGSLFYISYRSWYLGVVGSAYFILAWTVSIVAGMIAIALVQGLLAYSNLAYYSFGVAGVVDIVLLAYALGAKIQSIETQKLKTQKELVEREKEISRLNHQDKKELEALVSKRTQELVRINKTLQELSVTDKLTGLYNRVKLDKELLYALKYAKRYESPFSLILLDIDYFKLVNDEHGHLVGDKILIEFANILKFTIRNTDVLGRWGGEEFLIICPKTDKKGALALGESIRNKVSEVEFSVIKSKTASLGVTTSLANDTVQSILKRTDTALYDAKESGRNRVNFR